MANSTTNYNLKKPLGTENYNVDDQNGNMDIIDAAMKIIENEIDNITVPVTSVNTKTGAVVLSASDIKVADGSSIETHLAEIAKFQTATGNQWAITLNLPTLYDGYSVTFIANTSSTSGNVFINGIPFLKPNTTIAPTFIAGKAYTAWYSLASNCFFLKASAEGTSVASDVLAGKSFSNDSDTGIVGIMPDLGNGYVVRGTAWTSKNWVKRPDVDVVDVEFVANETGRVDTTTKYELGISNLLPKNIIEGVNVAVGANGMIGTAPIPIPLISGTSVVLNSGVVETYSLTPAKLFEKTVLANGVVRVGTFLDSVYYVDTVVYCRIYKNGIAVGTTRTKITSISPIQYYDDIAINKGDLIQVFGWTNMGTKASKVTVTLEIGNSFFQ